MTNTISIKNLKKGGDSLRWEWEIDGVHYMTNANGEGLWKEEECGIMLNEDGSRGAATEMRQIAGTSQYSMVGCNSYSSAYSHIKRYFGKDYV